MLEIFQGEIGKEFEIDTKINLINIQEKWIYVTKPDGSQLRWFPEIKNNKKGQPTILFYKNKDVNDFDQLGIYNIQGYMKFNDKEIDHTKVGKFKVVISKINRIL